jgi:hypothetical protein
VSSYKATPLEIRRIVDRADEVRARGIRFTMNPEGEVFLNFSGDLARVLGPDLSLLVAEYHEGNRRERDLEVIIDQARERLDKLLNPARNVDTDGFTPGLSTLLDQLETRAAYEAATAKEP